MGYTITEKILNRACGKKTTPGEVVFVKPDVLVFHEMSFLKTGHMSVPDKLKELGIAKVNFDPSRIVVGIDHRIPAHDIAFALADKLAREFVREQGIKFFFDIGRGGINHQADAERGIALPGMLYGAGDPMGITNGAMGCLALGSSPLEVLAAGQFWMRVPYSMRFELTGKLRTGVMSRDVIQQIVGDLGAGGAINNVMEFSGPGVETMNLDYRFPLCNLTNNAGAVSGIVPADKKTVDYATKRAKWPFKPVASDPDAEYSKETNYDLSKIEPVLAVPHDPTNTKTVAEVEGTKVDQGFIGTCAGGRLDELRVAAQILKGRKVNPDTRLIIIPPTPETWVGALKEGLTEIFVQAEAVVGPPNCGSCAGGHMGVLGPGEVCISTQTLNTQGRSGSDASSIYLASPATVAASAVNGRITDPRKYLS